MLSFDVIMLFVHSLPSLDLWQHIHQLQVTEADIEEFEANYRGSDSEKKDLIDLYSKYKGNMNRYW